MRVPTVVLCALLLCGFFLAVGTVTATSYPAEDRPSQTLSTGQPLALQSADSPLEPADPSQLIRVSLAETGDATWSVESRFLLYDEDDHALFEEYAAEVTAGERTGGYDSTTFEAYAEYASETTDREMRIEDGGWDEPRVETPDEDDLDDVQIGVISYSVTWTNFAAVDGDRIRLDAFTTADGGTWLPGLLEGQRFVIERPPNYGLETATVLSWDGPHEFEASDLEIVFVQTGMSVSGSQWFLAGIGGLLLGAGGYVLVRYLQNAEWAIPTQDDETEPPTESDTETTTPEPSESDTGTAVAYEEPRESDVDLELLSDEERVTRLLNQNGGRMKQANIVKETGWSNAKVSQLLSQMDDDEEIEKLRIGRENLITLPDVDPTEAE